MIHLIKHSGILVAESLYKEDKQSLISIQDVEILIIDLAASMSASNLSQSNQECVIRKRTWNETKKETSYDFSRD